jgi:recombinational DNA repair protein (RecF pathway)
VPAESLQTDALVLLKRSAADSFQSLTVFSAAHGSMLVLQRISKKSAPTLVALDLFDEVSLVLESSNQGRTWFIKEAQLIRRHAEIGRSYEALRQACAFATLISRNSVDEDSRPAVAALLRSAFAAFESANRPDIVYFKSVYRFARDEGYPMKQEWFPTLPADDRREVATLLNRPLVEQTATPANVTRLQRRLDEYLRGNTEILIS